MFLPPCHFMFSDVHGRRDPEPLPGREGWPGGVWWSSRRDRIARHGRVCAGTAVASGEWHVLLHI